MTTLNQRAGELMVRQHLTATTAHTRAINEAWLAPQNRGLEITAADLETVGLRIINGELANTEVHRPTSAASVLGLWSSAVLTLASAAVTFLMIYRDDARAEPAFGVLIGLVFTTAALLHRFNTTTEGVRP